MPPTDHPHDRVYLSPPHMTGREMALVSDAFESNWIAPLGPHVDRFEQEFQQRLECGSALAVSSGTGALHLALAVCNVQAGDRVYVSSLTFAASVYPILYLGARPVLFDSEPSSWNIDPELVTEKLEADARRGTLPKAVVVVHLYGQTADMDTLVTACDTYGIPIIEDAAEALGATYRGRPAGTLGTMGFYSFNGNKIITTSGGGMLVGRDSSQIEHARKLATQARDPAPHYQHSEVGYNYRLSNLLAGVGLAQLEALPDRVEARRANFDRYHKDLFDLRGLTFMPEASWGRHSRWLTTLLVDAAEFGTDRESIRALLEEHDIESRPLWKPMHLQPVFRDCEYVGGDIAETLFQGGLCLPSGSNLSNEDLERVVDLIRGCREATTRAR